MGGVDNLSVSFWVVMAVASAKPIMQVILGVLECW